MWDFIVYCALLHVSDFIVEDQRNVFLFIPFVVYTISVLQSRYIDCTYFL